MPDRIVPYAPEYLDRIRADRHERGRTLGELHDTYGARAVVAALGVPYLAYALGVDKPVVDYDDFYEDDYR